ncbi:hypothetical protein JY651_48200 [Pyxidicoccus parkwayensis]|uniref:Uncharacterized protein n=1 Tax=Pyxidicoccus parkwayensis TaxID=2813578 RepID=A0ABX7NWE5_9BACT|nr:hypothetical protein [Pyxidicoccus parkwaysis]QSQ22798.1 hypothetical protein JY651_48200 [Pyxidicoccus parkwaysis]
MTKSLSLKSLSLKSLSPVVALAALGIASVASAGLQTRMVSCTKNTDGSGRCYGNFIGFREDAAATTSAQFRDDLAGNRSFYARATVPGATTDTAYTCIPDATVSSLWELALSSRGFFDVRWDANGTCTYLRLSNSSLNTNY